MTTAKFPKNSDDFLVDDWVMLYGPNNAGKSIAALSLSDYWPDQVPTKEPKFLEDVFVLQFDKGALSGLGELGLDAPKVNLHRISDFNKFKREMYKYLAVVAKSPEIKVIVLDTVTQFNNRLFAHYFGLQTGDEPPAVKDKNSQRNWGKVREENLRLVETLSCMKPHVVVLAQHKDISNQDDDKRRAKAMGDFSDVPGIIPDIIGSAYGIWISACSLVLPMGSKVIGGKTQRQFQVKGTGGALGKNRFQQSLTNPTEPANLRLLFQKIRKSAESF